MNSLIAPLADKLEHNQRQMLKSMSKNKEYVKEEIDQLVKTVKIDISTELLKAQTTFVSEVRFMMEQLQGELQQDIKTYLVTLQRNHDQMSTELTQCTQTTKTLCTAVQDFQTLGKQLAGLQLSEQSSPSPSVADSSATLGTGPSPLPLPVVKSDHLKLTFPTFGSQMMLTHCCI